MYIISIKESFDAAHFLKDHGGKCANIHGHRWTVEAEVTAENVETEGKSRGMVVDFADLKDALKDETDRMDHCLIYEAGSLFPETLAALGKEGFRLVEFVGRPTAENMARFFFDRLAEKGIPVSAVTVFETPRNKATYRRNPA